MQSSGKLTLIELTAEVASAYLSNNAVRSADVPGLVASLHKALGRLGQAPAKPVATAPVKPAVNPKKSVTDDYIVCLEDGRKFKSMSQHLAKLGMTPEDYRLKWGLPHDYPMTAPGYSKTRSEVAKAMGLGRKTGEPASPGKR